MRFSYREYLRVVPGSYYLKLFRDVSSEKVNYLAPLRIVKGVYSVELSERL